jgi:hypothetical protein
MLKNFIPEQAYISEFRLVIASLLIPYFAAFYALVYSTSTSILERSTSSCWSYLPNCEDFYFLQALPFGYSQTIFYAGIFLVFLLAIEGLIKERWRQVWWMLSLLFVWKLYTSFVIGTQPGNYEYYDIVLMIVVLFAPYKAWFLRLAFVFLYFLAATIKIHEGWILGTYFTSLETGLAIFGNTIAPIVTMLVIVGQIFGAWFLLSQHESRRNAAFIFFFIFHLYSIIYVGWRYPTSDLFMLCTLFYLYKNPAPVPLFRKTILPYAFLLLLLCMQFVPKLIPGDQKFTLEGNNLGLYMFEANHQCISTLTILKPGAKVAEKRQTMNISAQIRCNPSFYLQRIKKACAENPSYQYAWTFDHSINGGPFYRMIDEANACALEYKTFKKNLWIKHDFDNMEIIGYPLRNYY